MDLKTMKPLGLTTLVMFTLAACGTDKEKETETTESESTEEVVQLHAATVKVIDGDEVIADYSVNIEEAKTAFEVLSEPIEVESEETEFGQYVKSIDGISENPDEGKYWMYYVNDEMPEVSADHYELEDGDEVVWVLEAM